MHAGDGPIVHRLTQTASTQRIARDYIELGAARVGHVVIADAQTAGAGRHGRAWLSPVGGFYATFIVSGNPQIAVRAGLAVACSLEELCVPIKLKWPNDLVVGEAKLGGILIEMSGGLALVGIGLNLEERPLDGAACLRELGVTVDRFALARAIHIDLATRAADVDLLTAYRSRLVTLGQRVRVERGGGAEPLVGTAVDVDSEGRLLVEVVGERVAVASGDCIHLRAA